jgi:hypothetical protein
LHLVSSGCTFWVRFARAGCCTTKARRHEGGLGTAVLAGGFVLHFWVGWCAVAWFGALSRVWWAESGGMETGRWNGAGKCARSIDLCRVLSNGRVNVAVRIRPSTYGGVGARL